MMLTKSQTQTVHIINSFTPSPLICAGSCRLPGPPRRGTPPGERLTGESLRQHGESHGATTWTGRLPSRRSEKALIHDNGLTVLYKFTPDRTAVKNRENFQWDNPERETPDRSRQKGGSTSQCPPHPPCGTLTGTDAHPSPLNHQFLSSFSEARCR